MSELENEQNEQTEELLFDDEREWNRKFKFAKEVWEWWPGLGTVADLVHFIQIVCSN